MATNDVQMLWSIPITEFVLPDGQQHERRLMATDNSNQEEIENILKIPDVRFEMERLRTGDVSFTVTHREFGDLSSVLIFASKTEAEKEEIFGTWFNGLKADDINEQIERLQLEDAEDDDNTGELPVEEDAQAIGKAEHERLNEISKAELEASLPEQKDVDGEPEEQA